MILATDLDGTFLGGDDSHKKLLYRLFKDPRDNQLIFVTGRGLDSVRSVLLDSEVPRPDYVIGDVGATVVDGKTFQPIKPLQKSIAERWPGRGKIEEMLSNLNGLVAQDVPQHRRCSYYVDDQAVLEQVKLNLSSMPVEIIYSADKFLDILPQGVNKGSSLKALIKYLGLDPLEVIVAGDTLNDLTMFQCGFKGVAVGNSEIKLLESINGTTDTFVATSAGAGGILEALLHFRIMRQHTIDYLL